MLRKNSIKWTVVAVGSVAGAAAVAGFLWYLRGRNSRPLDMAFQWVQDNPQEIADIIAVWIQINNRYMSSLSSRWIASMVDEFISWDYGDLESISNVPHVTHSIRALSVVSIGIPADAGLPYSRIYARVPWVINVNANTREVTAFPLFGEARLGVFPEGHGILGAR